MVLALALACFSTKPSSTKPSSTPHSGTEVAHTGAVATHTGSTSSDHTGSCEGDRRVEGVPASLVIPGEPKVTDVCLQSEPLADVCDRAGWTSLFGGCPTWDLLRAAILDGTVTSVLGYELSPAEYLYVDTCVEAGVGDWHYLYVYPFEYYDAGSYDLVFDATGALSAVGTYGYYYTYCCEAEVVNRLWVGAVPPSTLTCDGGTPLAPR